MTTPQSPQSFADDSQPKDIDEQDAVLLERVAEKLVWYGALRALQFCHKPSNLKAARSSSDKQ
jgi:hypothetical protein